MDMGIQCYTEFHSNSNTPEDSQMHQNCNQLRLLDKRNPLDTLNKKIGPDYFGRFQKDKRSIQEHQYCKTLQVDIESLICFQMDNNNPKDISRLE